MNKTDAQPELVPRLRFPEFRGRESWQTTQLADLYRFKRTNTLSRDKLNYEAGTIKNIHYGDIHTKFRALFRVRDEYVPYVNPDVSEDAFDGDAYCEEGDIVLADASEDLNDVGKAIEIMSLDGQRVVAGTHTILATRRKDEPIVGFGGYLFQSAAVRAGIHKEAQGAKVYGISANRIAAISLPLPPPAEQHKIAECLGSLDDLIAAEGRKLAALRDHKRGLMQQLFPREGEPRPRLRFPDFQDAPGWDEKRLEQIAEFQSGGTPSKGNSEYWNGSIPWVSAKDMKNLVLDDTGHHITDVAVDHGAKVMPAGTVLMLTRGMTLLKDIPICLLARPMSFNQDVRALRPKNGFDGRFLAYMLVGDKQRIRSMVDIAGHGTGRLNTDRMKGLELLFPPPAEQQRIADCLASLDALIAAQEAKLDALRTHKRSLMQQLFPSPEDVGA